MNNGLREVIFSGIVAVRDRLLKMDSPLRLESGEPNFDTPEHIKEAMVKALRDNHTHYAPSTGIKPLKEAVLKKITEKNGIDYVDKLDKITIVNGGMHGLYSSFRTILNPGDEVIIPQPNWTATSWMIDLAGGKTVKVPLNRELEYRWDINDVADAIRPKTTAILINSPHNPTGGVMTEKDLTDLLYLAEKHKLWVISDEAYEDIIYDEQHVSLAKVAKQFPWEVRDKVISCFTFSKSYAMTGWRLGYVVCTSQEFTDNIKKMILYTINGVSTMTQYGGIAALEGPQDCIAEMVQAYRERRDLLVSGVNKTGFLRCEHPPKGAFYLYARITEAWDGTPWDLVNHLIDRYSMGSVPGDIFYDDQPSIRFSYACSTDMIRQAIVNLTS